MRKSERDDLKRAIRGRITQSPPQLGLVTDFHWAVYGVASAIGFFNVLPVLMREGSVLYVEGTEIDPRIPPLYKKHLYPKPIDIAPDTLFPKPLSFHLTFTPLLCDFFKGLLKTNTHECLFHHVKGYSAHDVIFTFHDAFSGILRISHDVPEDVVKMICTRFDARYSLEATERPDFGVLTKLLNALENG
ncbi:MAG TPA: hypothetical protein VFC44_06280 [Candidatus Saccharimonadales bacterium]|nr:hypothetical protein [Candidatus Saccharimonadales bacterium]